MNGGLKKETIERIKVVFLAFPEITEVILYGSRARETQKNGSDIDLTLKGVNLNLDVLNKLNAKLDELFLPYTFDLSIFHQIDNADLIDHIQRIGKIFYKKLPNSSA